MQKSILIIEEDSHFCEALIEQLQKNYSEVNATTKQQALTTAKSLKPKIIISSEPKFHKEITNILPNTHIITLSDELQNGSVSLKKPFHINDLLKLLETDPQSYGLAQCEFNIGKHVFFALDKKLQTPNNDTLYLTDKEAVLLNYLCRYENKFVPRQDLLKEIWGYNNDMETHTLETHIYRLRQKLGSDGDCLTTEEGGYRLKNHA